MATKIIMPQAGQDIEEGRVVRWLKSEGDIVKKGEPLCEVETEKVVFEVESPEDGVLYKIIVPDDQKVKIFGTIGILAAPDEKVDVECLSWGRKTRRKGCGRFRHSKKIGKERGCRYRQDQDFRKGTESLRKRRGWISPPWKGQVPMAELWKKTSCRPLKEVKRPL